MLMRKLYLFSRSAVKEEKLDNSRLRGNFLFIFSFILFFLKGGGGGGEGGEGGTLIPLRQTILFFLWGERNTDASMPNLRLISPPLFATLETRRRLEPKYVLQLFWDSIWGRAGQPLGSFFPVTVPEVFAKVNSSQFPF